MRLNIGVRRVLRCESQSLKCFNVKSYVSALVGVIIKVILQNARCNNKNIPISIRLCLSVYQQTKMYTQGS